MNNDVSPSLTDTFKLFEFWIWNIVDSSVLDQQDSELNLVNTYWNQMWAGPFSVNIYLIDPILSMRSLCHSHNCIEIEQFMITHSLVKYLTKVNIPVAPSMSSLV